MVPYTLLNQKQETENHHHFSSNFILLCWVKRATELSNSKLEIKQNAKLVIIYN